MVNENDNKKFIVKSNIMDSESTNQMMNDTLSFLAEVLSKSLGPYGSTTIIQDRMLNHTITKDGYSILKKIYIEQEESRTILDLVMKISRTLVRRVGDGSTSSIIIANSLYKAVCDIINTYNMPPKDLLDILNTFSELTVKKIKEMTMEVDDEFSQLKYIAAVSTNNDQYLGEIIKDVFKEVGKYGFVNIESSKTNKTYYDNTRGFEINRGLINKIMINSDDGKSAEYENVFVFMCDSYLAEEDIPMLTELIGTICLRNGQPMLIVAKGYDNSVHTFMHMNCLNNKNLQLACIDISTDSQKSFDRFIDLATNVGCTPYLKANGEKFESFPLERLGQCRKIVATETFTRIIEGMGDKDQINKRINLIKDILDEKIRHESYIDLDDEIFNLRKRLACLENTMVTLYIGGETENEKETVKYLVEDAVFACKSALHNGYTLGGNLIIPIIYADLNNRDEFINVVKEKFNYLLNIPGITESMFEDIYGAINSAFEDSYLTVLRNCFGKIDVVYDILDDCVLNKSILNLKNMNKEKMEETTIINSIETDIEILKSAISIIGLLVTSNQFVKINIVK
jgi:chaperonin GroEL